MCSPDWPPRGSTRWPVWATPNIAKAPCFATTAVVSAFTSSVPELLPRISLLCPDLARQGNILAVKVDKIDFFVVNPSY